MNIKKNQACLRFLLPPVMLLALLLAPACNQNRVNVGRKVRIDYTLTVEGKVVDTSTGKEPLVYVVGDREILPGLEEQLMGMKVGEKKHVTLTSDKGYGPVNPIKQQKVPLKDFRGSDLRVGMTVTGRSKSGKPLQAKVLEIGDKDVLLDFNHPLAGKTLEFDVQIVDVSFAKS
jgi:FKBP-type peptidyl-prolyl cis-trans isomerase 2